MVNIIKGTDVLFLSGLDEFAPPLLTSALKGSHYGFRVRGVECILEKIQPTLKYVDFPDRSSIRGCYVGYFCRLDGVLRTSQK